MKKTIPSKILVCAYACDPEGGSERHVGWTGVRLLARKHRVTVLTHAWGREPVEHALASLPERENLKFIFIGGRHTWHQNRLIAKMQDWSRLSAWTKSARRLALELVRSEQFDLAHHITIATWRSPSPLAGLGIPLVFGPVGGGESFPLRFSEILSPSAKVFEGLRGAANVFARTSPRLKRFAKQIAVAMGNNPETLAALRKVGVPDERLQFLSQSFLGEAKFLLEDAVREKAERQRNDRPLKIFAGGNCEGRKGVAIALEGLQEFGRRGYPFSFTFGGLGPELGHLTKLAAAMNFGAGSVSLGQHLDGEEYRRALAEADVYLLPSLREGAPITMIEAMAAGAIPIIADAGGAPMVVDETCGRVIAVTTPRQMALRIADHLEFLALNPAQRATLARAAWLRAKERCMEDTYLKGVDEAYAQARGARV